MPEEGREGGREGQRRSEGGGREGQGGEKEELKDAIFQ